MAATQTIAPLVLPHAVWTVTPGRDGPTLTVQPSTWTRLRRMAKGQDGRMYRTLALVGCPNPRGLPAHPLTLAERVHTVNAVGRVRPIVRCPELGCGFVQELYLDEYHRQPLHCVAYRDARDVLQLEYTLAPSAREAEARFRKTMNPRDVVIAVGRAVGFLYDEQTETVHA